MDDTLRDHVLDCMNKPRRENLRKKGGEYEQVAVAYLKEKGYRILRRNVYTPYGEVDILAEKDHIFYFIEVKFRSSGRYGTPKSAITRGKYAHMVRCMQYLRKQSGTNRKCKLGFLGIRLTQPESIGSAELYQHGEKQLWVELLAPLVYP